MRLVINGEPRELEEARTVAELPAALGLPAAALLIEHNGVALRREEWAGRALAEGDAVELVRVVAGG